MGTCRDVMTRDPVCCLPTDALERAALVLEACDGPVPVVDGHDSRVLVGTVTVRDLAAAVVGRGRTP
jgi:CBS domain-containing protein